MPSIEDIKGVITSRGGLVRPNRFEVSFSGLAPMTGIDTPTATDLNYLVDSVSMPGRTINTFEYAIWNHPIKIPSGYDEDDVEMVFNLTNDYMPKKIIDAWSALVIDQNLYLARYDTDYKRDITIWQLDENNNKIYGILLVNAYPLTSKGILLDNSSESAVSRFSCTLTYDRFKVADIPNESIRQPKRFTTTDGISFGKI